MGLFRRDSKPGAKKLSPGEWDAFVSESIAEHQHNAPAPLAPDAVRPPFLERHLFGPLRRTAVTLTLVIVTIVVLAVGIIAIVAAAAK